MKNERKEGSKIPVEIAFGKVIERVSGGETTKYVVVDPGENDLFGISKIIETDGRKTLALLGSISPKEITRTTNESWTLEQILATYGSNLNPGRTPKEIVKMIKRFATRPPRIIA